MKAPALKIYAAARLWAQSNGEPFFYMHEVMRAVRRYLLYETGKN